MGFDSFMARFFLMSRSNCTAFSKPPSLTSRTTYVFLTFTVSMFMLPCLISILCSWSRNKKISVTHFLTSFSLRLTLPSFSTVLLRVLQDWDSKTVQSMLFSSKKSVALFPLIEISSDYCSWRRMLYSNLARLIRIQLRANEMDLMMQTLPVRRWRARTRVLSSSTLGNLSERIVSYWASYEFSKPCFLRISARHKVIAKKLLKYSLRDLFSKRIIRAQRRCRRVF